MLGVQGQGVVCIRAGGIPRGTHVEQYYGELYAPWRWFEKQDVLKKKNPNSGLPEFYNITLERPASDPAGYDVLFVEVHSARAFFNLHHVSLNVYINKQLSTSYRMLLEKASSGDTVFRYLF